VKAASLTDQLLEATDGDMFVRSAVANARITHGPWIGDGAAIWGMIHRGQPSIAGVGAPAGAAKLLDGALDEVPGAERASLPRGWLDHLPPRLGAMRRSDWDWLWTATTPVPVPGEDQAAWLTDDDTDEIDTLLTAASPDTSTWPGDGRARRWAGIHTDGGSLAAVLADTSRSPSVGHLSSIATAPAHRRQGHGAALTAWVTRQMLIEGADWVTLGMYADNDPARRLYERLGFACTHRFSSAIVINAS
jgi:GNAT superfamily N-acetyltransferase